MEAIKPLCILLLSKVAPLPPPAPIILPTPQTPTPLVNVDKAITIWNPQLVQPSLPTLNHNTNNISPNHNTPTIVEVDSDNDSPIPNRSTCPPLYHLIHQLQNCPLTCNQLQLRTAHMINYVIADKLTPTPSLCTCPALLHC
jgi:hypothetical protein